MDSLLGAIVIAAAASAVFSRLRYVQNSFLLRNSFLQSTLDSDAAIVAQKQQAREYLAMVGTRSRSPNLQSQPNCNHIFSNNDLDNSVTQREEAVDCLEHH